MAVTAQQIPMPPKRRVRTFKVIAILASASVLVVAGLLAFYFIRGFAYQWQAESHLRPPSTVKTINEFDAWIGGEARYFRRQDATGTGLTAHVQFHTAERWASGPASYVFDSSGKLIDWTIDIGDDGRFQAQWPFPQTGDAISRTEALKAIEAR